MVVDGSHARVSACAVKAIKRKTTESRSSDNRFRVMCFEIITLISKSSVEKISHAQILFAHFSA